MGLFQVGTQHLLCGLNPRPVPSPTPRPSQAFPALGHLLGDPLMTDLQVKGLRNPPEVVSLTLLELAQGNGESVLWSVCLPS